MICNPYQMGFDGVPSFGLRSLLYSLCVCLPSRLVLFCFVLFLLCSSPALRALFFSKGLFILLCFCALPRLCLLLVVVSLLVGFMVALLYESPRRKPG